MTIFLLFVHVRIVDANIQHAIAFAKLMVKAWVGRWARNNCLRKQAPRLRFVASIDFDYTSENKHGSQQPVCLGRIFLFKSVIFTVDRSPVNLFALSWFPNSVHTCAARTCKFCSILSVGKGSALKWSFYLGPFHGDSVAARFLCFQINLPQLASFWQFPTFSNWIHPRNLT